MREIKFKAFVKEENLIGDVTVLTDEGAFVLGAKTGKDKEYRDIDIKIKSPKEGRFCFNSEISLMQYIRQKDKNGKEVFEDDILKTIWGDIFVANMSILFNAGEVEIIGNSQESPELLKRITVAVEKK